MLKYLSPSYYVGAPGSEFHFYLPLGVLFGLFLLATIVSNLIIKRRWKHERWRVRVWSRFVRLGLAVAIVGLLLLGARYLNTPLASWRLWLLLDLLAMVGGLAWLGLFLVRRYPLLEARQELERQKRQYFHATRARRHRH